MIPGWWSVGTSHYFMSMPPKHLARLEQSPPSSWPRVMFPVTLSYPLSWLGHLLCQICALAVQSGSLLLITLCFTPFCWQVLSGTSVVLRTDSYPPRCLIKLGPKGEKMLSVSFLPWTPDFNILFEPSSGIASLIALNSPFEVSGVEVCKDLFRVQTVRWREACKYFRDSWNCLLCHQGRKTGGTLALR